MVIDIYSKESYTRKELEDLGLEYKGNFTGSGMFSDGDKNTYLMKPLDDENPGFADEFSIERVVDKDGKSIGFI